MRSFSGLVRAGLLVLGTGGCALAESRTYTLPPFDGVSVSGPISAVVLVGGEQSVAADASTSATLDRLHVEVRNRRLEVGFEWDPLDWLFNLGQNRGVLMHISVPALSSASASAAADVDVKSPAGETFSVDSSSGASLSVKDASSTRVSASSSSGATLTMAGTCDQFVGSTSSGANLAAESFECRKVEIDASSGGHAGVRATTSVKANASSGGGIAVFGAAADVQSETSSGGSISFAR